MTNRFYCTRTLNQSFRIFFKKKTNEQELKEVVRHVLIRTSSLRRVARSLLVLSSQEVSTVLLTLKVPW